MVIRDLNWVERTAVQRGGCRGARTAAATAASALALAVGLGASAARAEVLRFGAPGEAAGQFNEPAGVAVAQQSGDVYLVDQENARVERWGRGGVFELAWGWGVANGVAAHESCEAICTVGLEGGGGGELGELAGGVAVDNSLGLSRGDVYVGDPRNNRVEQFGADGTFIATFGGEVNQTEDGTPGATAAEKDVCTAASGDTCKAGVSGHGQGSFEGMGQDALAVDATGTLYVGDRERVQRFSAAGAFEGEVTLPGGTGSVAALGVDSSKALYVAESGETGVHKFEACAGSCVGHELGSPRDPEQSGLTLAVGSADELFVRDRNAAHVFEYAANGEEVRSLVEESTEGDPSIAVDQEASSLVLLDYRYVKVRPIPPAGPEVTEASETASELQPTSALLSAQVNPEGPSATSYRFEYGPTTAYGASTPEQPLSGEPFEDHTVTAALTALQPRTTYHFRVVVTNAASQRTFGSDATFTTLPPVGIESESVADVKETSATLVTALNPHGRATEYHFEYGPTTAYGEQVPVPDAAGGSGTSASAFSAVVHGLAPGTTYHYRVIASNSLGIVQGADRTFTTQTPEGRSLLDGRAWEQVSPADKPAVSLESIPFEGGVIESAAAGGTITYIANGPITSEAHGTRSLVSSQLLATRGSSGWSTEDITPPNEEVAGFSVGIHADYRWFSPDLSDGLVEPAGKTPLSPRATERTPYLRDGGGQFTPLVYPGNVPAGTTFGGQELEAAIFLGGLEFQGASEDLTHVVVSSPAALVEGLVPEGHRSLFEWSNGKLELVSIMPNGVPAAQEGVNAGLGRQTTQVRGAVSRDGRRVVFETGTGHLYLRDMTLKTSVQLDAPTPGAKGGAGKPDFQDATPDGSKVFFTDQSRLTPNASAAGSPQDLYMCEIGVVAGKPTCQLSDLTVALHPGEAAEVMGIVIGSDEAGRYVYFAANGALTPDATHGECREASTTGALCNLYVYDTLARRTALVGVVSDHDAHDWAAHASSLGTLTARVSSNGEWLAFMSARPLTGFDNTDARTGAADEEVFLYRRSAGALTCVSCARSGARPLGVFDNGEPPGLLVDRPLVWGGETLAGSIPGWTKAWETHAYYQSRYLSDEGRLFFNSSQQLVPAAANGAMDVYEFEPHGVGGCGSASGCVGLISSGESGEESAFVDASSSGNDIFFVTSAKLASTDKDNALDLYDAHVCTPALQCPSGAVSLPAACETAEQCRPAPSAVAPTGAAPATATPGSSGNFTVSAPPAAHPPTRAQLLKKALAACRHKPKRRRSACVRAAERRYGLAHSSHRHRGTKLSRRRK